MADGSPSAAGDCFQLPDSRTHQLCWKRDDIYSFFFNFTCWLSSQCKCLFLIWFICHYCSPFTCSPVNIKCCVYSKNIRLWTHLFWQPVHVRYSHCSSTQACRRKGSEEESQYWKGFALFIWGFLILFSRIVQRNISCITAPTGSRWYGSSEFCHGHQV